MLKILKIITFILITYFHFVSCTLGSSNNDSGISTWDSVKSNTIILNNQTDEYNTPYMLDIATLGWEDGINISRNGLYLYATYMPADLLSFSLNGSDVSEYVDYDRGPHYDMSFDGSAIGASYDWYQSDIIYASRTTVNDAFSSWYTSDMKRSLYSEGGFSAVFSGDTIIDILAFTSNDVYTAQNNIKIISNTNANPSGTGTLITTIDTTGTTSINTNYIEDNPHIERIDSNNLVLFFDSEDRPSGVGSHDIWYSTSSNNGSTWSSPVNVSSINSTGQDHQPHLYNDGTDWWLYYSAKHTDNKLGIFRAKQGTADDWDSWGTPELVLGAGNAAGIGEPTLTDNGDLFFVVVYENPDGTYYDTYDADAWLATRIIK